MSTTSKTTAELQVLIAASEQLAVAYGDLDTRRAKAEHQVWLKRVALFDAAPHNVAAAQTKLDQAIAEFDRLDAQANNAAEAVAKSREHLAAEVWRSHNHGTCPENLFAKFRFPVGCARGTMLWKV